MDEEKTQIVHVNPRRESPTRDDSGEIQPAIAEDPSDLLDPEDSFPEGGLQAWLVVFAAFMVLFVGFGMHLSIGTLQDYWELNQLAAYPPRDVGWISSLFVYLGLALGIAAGPVVDRYGPRYVLLFGSVTYEVAIFLLAECRTYWQFMLCCGILAGATTAALTTTSLTIVAQWFKARRAFAQGIAMAGSAVGGVVIPLLLRATLLTSLGYQWSIRILGFVFLVCLTLGNLLLKPRLHRSPKKQVSIFSLSLYRDARFAWLAIGVFATEVVLLGTTGIIPTYITYTTEFPQRVGYYLIAVFSTASFFGRILPGYVADKIGRFNAFIIMIMFTLTIMLAIWLPLGHSSLPALYVFVALFGFGTGSWMGLTPASLGQLCRAEDYGRYYGTMYFIASISTLICLPIDGELLTAVGPQKMIVFECVVLVLALVALIMSRWACLGWKWSWTARI